RIPARLVGVVAGRQVDPERSLVRVAEHIALQRVAVDGLFVEAAGPIDRPRLHASLLSSSGGRQRIDQASGCRSATRPSASFHRLARRPGPNTFIPASRPPSAKRGNGPDGRQSMAACRTSPYRCRESGSVTSTTEPYTFTSGSEPLLSA